MRTFGFLAAFAAFTSTFAAPLPGPGAKVVAVRDLPADPATPPPPATPVVPSPSTPSPPVTPAVPSPSTPSTPATPTVPSPSTPSPPTTPATPGVAAPGDASVQDGSVHVGVSLTGICLSFQVNVHAIVSQICTILDGVEDKVEGTVGGAVTTVNGVTADIDAKVNAIIPLLNDLLSEIEDILGKLVAYVVPTVTGAVSDTEDMAVEELGHLLRGVEEEVSGVLCRIVTLIEDLYPTVAGIIKFIIIKLSLVLKAVCAIVGGVQTFLCPINTLVGTIISAFNWVIPDLF